MSSQIVAEQAEVDTKIAVIAFGSCGGHVRLPETASQPHLSLINEASSKCP